MKKLFLLFAITSLTIYSKADDGAELGIKTGINFTNITGGETEDLTSIETTSTPKAGFSIGIYTKVPMSKNLSLQPEFYYSYKISKIETKTSMPFGDWPIDEEPNYEWNIHTDIDNEDIEFKVIDIPILLNYTIVKGKQADVYIIAGPSISFILNNSEGPYNQTTWSLQTGLGVKLSRFNLDSRYELGLSSITDSDSERKINSFQINLSYQLF